MMLIDRLEHHIGRVSEHKPNNQASDRFLQKQHSYRPRRDSPCFRHSKEDQKHRNPDSIVEQRFSRDLDFQ
jgi:hypothetical protein